MNTVGNGGHSYKSVVGQCRPNMTHKKQVESIKCLIKCAHSKEKKKTALQTNGKSDLVSNWASIPAQNTIKVAYDWPKNIKGLLNKPFSAGTILDVF